MSRPESVKHKYQALFERLSRDIMTGRYKPGQKFPSEAALVKRFGMSRITVGRALRELQQGGFVDRVAGSGTYVRDATAQRPRENLLFGLIIPNLGDTEIFEPICQGIAASPDASGHGLLWASTGAGTLSKEEQALQLCQQCIAHSVSGVFFAPLELSEHSAEVNRRVMQLLKRPRFRWYCLIAALRKMPWVASAAIWWDLDNHRAGYLATQHLARLGARRIGFIGYENQASTVKARIAGYKDAFFMSASNAKEERVFFVRSSTSGDRLDLPAAARKCDAFVCANDRVAGHLMHTLLAEGLRIPQDVRLVGIDDVNYAGLLPVPLTTVHQPCRDIGETALRTMLERLDRPQTPARDILLDCELVIRNSCGAAALSSQC
ncbi:MAG: GntR family transcriptional regulator [Pyrinomonadaceae bacterium]